MGLSSKQRSTVNKRLLRKEELISLSKDECLNWLSNTKWPDLKSYAYQQYFKLILKAERNVKLNKKSLKRLYLYMYAYVCITTIIKEKKAVNLRGWEESKRAVERGNVTGK